MRTTSFGVRLAALALGLMLGGTSLAQEVAPPPPEPQVTSAPTPPMVSFADFRDAVLADVRAEADAGSAGAAFAAATALLAAPNDLAAQAEGALYLEQAAEAGIVEAQVRYAGFLRTGAFGIPIDRDRARDLLEDAASTGDGVALAALGLYVLDTQLGLDGRERGLSLLEDAVEAGNTDAANTIGSLYLQGRAVAVDARKALDYFKIGLVAGSTASISIVADLLRTGGVNLPADTATALALYREAATRGNVGAARRLADMTLRGDGVPVDLDQAIQQLTDLAARGDTQAYFALADIHLTGEFLEPDGNKARDYLQKAADAGNLSGFRRIADLYRFGAQGIDPDLETAMEYYQRAADLGDTGSRRALANIYLDLTQPVADPLRGIELLEEAAAAGDSTASVQLGQLYSINDILTADYQLATQYFDLALSQGNIGATIDRAVALASGPLATEHRDEALQLLTAAVESGVPEAAASLARLQLGGAFPGLGAEGVMSMLLDATQKGDITAARYLLELYRDGFGIALQPDREAAVNLLATLEPMLGAEGVAVERILIGARDPVSPESMQSIADQFEALTRARGTQVLRQLRRVNPRAYVYIVQQKLAGLGIYNGPISGTLDARTIGAIRVACERAEATAQCAPGPLTDGAVQVIGNFLYDQQSQA